MNPPHQPPDRPTFERDLADLETRFEDLEPEFELVVRDPALGLKGYVVVWSTLNAIGGPLGQCGKGGTRITPSLSLEEVRMLARTQSLKNAAAGLPLGGAKSGLAADPQSAGFETLYRQFVRLVAPALRQNGGPWGGFGFDLGAAPIHAEWACDELNSTSCFTGKSVARGGTDYDAEGIAGLGVVVAATTLLAYQERPVDSTRCAVQGLGAMGAAVCRYASQEGMQVQFLADPRVGGCWRLESALTGELRDAIIHGHFEKARKLLEAGPHSLMDLDDILTQQVDILFPCAVQYVIREENVDQVSARAVVEGANNPLTPEARARLYERGVTVIPDIIANPGGAIAAFVELTSEVSEEENIRTRAKVEEAKEFTRRKVADNVREVLTLADAVRVDPVRAAFYLAYRRVFGEVQQG
jgi:glutamate dehydrogenase (NAD(P)+)